jgi:hypothetical protein
MSAVEGWALPACQGARARWLSTSAGVVAGGRVPGDGDGVASELERNGAAGCAGRICPSRCAPSRGIFY